MKMTRPDVSSSSSNKYSSFLLTSTASPRPSSTSPNPASPQTSSMPKKRFTPLYTKPQDTAHPSLHSAATASSSNHTDAPPTVNDLISSLRKATISSSSSIPSTVTTHTLPPQIRHLLAQPETLPPAPRAQNRRRLDANGRRLPAGPPPPRSWLTPSRYAPKALRNRQLERFFPVSVGHLPGLPVEGVRHGMRLQDMCLRAMAKDWEYIKEYEKFNLAGIPTGLRMQLLSNIAVYGPEEGIGFEAFKDLLVAPNPEDSDNPMTSDSGENNESFYRVDLSGSIERTITLKQLGDLLEAPVESANEEIAKLSWEESLTRPLRAPIPHLTHLSLSYPPPHISWSKLLAFTKHTPTLTHLSLAYWPVPSLTPNARTTVVSSKYTRDIQYGGTNFYSHILDNDFREAADILRRLASRLYGLKYLDLSGSTDWLRALRWMDEDGGAAGNGNIDWQNQWVKLETVRVYSGIELTEQSEISEVVRFIQGYKEALATQSMLGYWAKKSLASGRNVIWKEVEKDDWRVYMNLWQGDDEQDVKKRTSLKTLGHKNIDHETQWRSPIVYDADEDHRGQNGGSAWD